MMEHKKEETAVEKTTEEKLNQRGMVQRAFRLVAEARPYIEAVGLTPLFSNAGDEDEDDDPDAMNAEASLDDLYVVLRLIELRVFQDEGNLISAQFRPRRGGKTAGKKWDAVRDLLDRVDAARGEFGRRTGPQGDLAFRMRAQSVDGFRLLEMKPEGE